MYECLKYLTALYNTTPLHPTRAASLRCSKRRPSTRCRPGRSGRGGAVLGARRGPGSRASDAALAGLHYFTTVGAPTFEVAAAGISFSAQRDGYIPVPACADQASLAPAPSPGLSCLVPSVVLTPASSTASPRPAAGLRHAGVRASPVECPAPPCICSLAMKETPGHGGFIMASVAGRGFRRPYGVVYRIVRGKL